MQGLTQIVIIVLILLFDAYVLSVLRKELIDFQYAIIWISAGLVMLAFSIYPPMLDRLAILIGIGLPLNLLFFMSILFLLLLCFRINISYYKMKRKLYTLTQHLAILEKRLGEMEHMNLESRIESSKVHE